MNLEDGYPAGDGEGIRPGETAAARDVAEGLLLGFWIHARADICLRAKPETHAACLDDVISRGRAFAGAGASSLFMAGLRDLALIR
ncbi:isocitrate lyase/phosphoenolpyruvate mutase family protein [Hyphomonas sp.]|uniref:isocitrate lyase/phosphoenolpyruvate mutase family protein n=1 Tax=Hyphomonas sp. TaxID=87 RepID=UPI00333E6058